MSPSSTPTTTTTLPAPTGVTGVTTSVPETTTTTTVREATSVGQCTVLEIGDSLGNDLGWGINRLIGGTRGLHLVQLDKSSTGLSNSWFYNWAQVLPGAIRQYHPDLVIIFLGANDQQGMMVNGHAQAFATPDWKDAYEQNVRTIVGDATRSGAYVTWVGLPIMGPYGYNLGAQYLNSLFQRVVPTFAGATFVPTYSLLALHGAFSSTLPLNGFNQVARSPDGIHLSVAGEDCLATYVISQLRNLYHVRLIPHGAVVRTP